MKAVTANSDSDCAGDKNNRSATSGGGACYQSTVDLPSAEAELYAVIKIASKTLGILSILGDWSIHVSGDLLADASAALGIIVRTGLGKLRHLYTSYLQQQSIKEKIKMCKVLGTDNPADMNTKGLNGGATDKFV